MYSSDRSKMVALLQLVVRASVFVFPVGRLLVPHLFNVGASEGCAS